jgi:hypothetical protein
MLRRQLLRRPSARGLLNLCTAASVLLLLGVCTLWAWSYSSDGTLVLSDHKRETILGPHDYSDRRWEIAWSRGTLHERQMHRHRYWPGNTGVPPAWWPVPEPPPRYALWELTFFRRLRNEDRFGFGVRWDIGSSSQYPGPVVTAWRDRYMPLWPLAPAAAPAPRRSARRRLATPLEHSTRPLPPMRLRPSRHAGPLSRVRRAGGLTENDGRYTRREAAAAATSV